MILFDEVVKLRAIEESDAAVLMDLINDPEIEQNVLGYSFPVSLAQQKKWIADAANEKTIRYIIEAKGEAVGTAIVSSLDYKNGTGNLNIKLLKTARGKGYASHTVSLLLNYCFEELNINCVIANVLEYNDSSKHLWEKFGFSLDGVLRERVYKKGKYHNVLSYSLLQGEWHERNRK